MEVATRELENRQAVLTATMDEEWLEPFMRTASRRLAGRLDIPGFRRGKAPHAIVLRHAGREALVREVIEDLGRTAYDEAVAESGLEPIQLDDLEIDEWDPLTLRMTVSLPPVVALGDYKEIPLEIKPVEVGEEDVNEVLEELQEQYAEKVSVERPAELPDFVLLDVQGTVDGRVVSNLEQQEYDLQEGDDGLVARLREQVMGMSPGEEKRFEVDFPEDHEDEDLAGQRVSFLVRLHNVQEKQLPPMDDALAKMAGGLNTLDELRQEVSATLQLRREARQLDELADGLLDTLLEQAEVDSPPVFVNRELEVMVGGLAYELQEQGFTLEGYLNTTGRSVDDLLDEFRPAAEKRVKKSLILAELVKVEGVEVKDAEIEEEVGRMSRVYGQEKAALKDALLGNEQIREEIRNRLYGRKIVSTLSGPLVTDKSQAGEVEPAPPEGPDPSGERDSEPHEE